jgi:hypothetical protein
VVDIIEELRRERKIKMAIKDANYVKTYIRVDPHAEEAQGDITKHWVNTINKDRAKF